MNILRIIQGHWNNLLSINEELKDFRIKNGCEKCVLYKDGWCASPKDHGCGCNVMAKGSIQDAKCINGIWHNDVVNEDKLKEVNEKYKK